MIATFCLHVISSTIIAYLFSLVFGGLTVWIAVVSLAIGYWYARRRARLFVDGFEDLSTHSFSNGTSRWIEAGLGAFLLFVSYRQFGWMLYYNGDELRTLHLNNFGDLPLHLNYIRYLTSGAEFPPLNPVFGSEPLFYPVGMDLYSALWEQLGVSTGSHLFIVGILASLAAFVALRAWAGWWGVGGFFFGGGWLAWQTLLQTGAGPMDGVAWKNLFLSVWITQRGMLLALPAGLLLLTTARRAFRGELALSRMQLRTLGFVWGAMPLFHLHSFFAVSVILTSLAWIYRSHFYSFAVLRRLMWTAVPFGTIFVYYLTDGFGKASLAHWRPGWMAGGEGFDSFLFLNFRFWLLLFATLPVFIYLTHRLRESSETKSLAREFSLFLFLFVLFLNLMLAPWEWDNIKVLIWPYLGLLMVAHRVLTPMFARITGGALCEAALAFVLLLPGLMIVGHSTVRNLSSVKIGSILDLSSTEGAMALVPRTALILAAPTHDHPIALLGWRRALGYQGHLWSHGIDSSKVTNDVDLVMRGNAGWREAVLRLGATHIVWGRVERSIYGEAPDVWKSTLPNRSRVAGYEVYEIQ